MASVSQASDYGPVRRYSNAAVALHWITAALILVQIWLGYSFADLERSARKTELFTWHKTIGVTILLVALIRLGYRLANPPPAFPDEMPRWEKVAATINHWAFYVLIIVLPLTGLVAVSGRSPGGSTSLVGGVPLPTIPGISKDMGESVGAVHGTLVVITIALLVLHVGAALKQQFFDRPGRVAGRMPPFQPRTGEPVVSD